ncbi:MAG: hypothetical protein N4A64_04875 [Marinisporobacter sp.]|jgi:hypothetical protein|nr:hypothetical protein [Marinisporobacter sp.]
MFNYEFYGECLKILKKSGYSFESFSSEKYSEKYIVYLRHDVDNDFLGAYNLAKIESQNKAKSIFFFLPNHSLYNMLSFECLSLIKKINNMGHEIGIHIDASLFKEHKELVEYTKNTFHYYSDYLPITNIISFHCPTPLILNNNIVIDGFINTYEKRFFKDIKYFSDSNRRKFWKNNFYDSIKKGLSMQFLTHPFWWGHFEQSIYESYNNFSKKMDLYKNRALIRNAEPISIIASWLNQEDN